MSIVGGGPSLADNLEHLTGYIAAVNGAHDFLIGKGIVPNACGLLDPHPILAERFTPHPDVTYFVASMCHPDVFDKLKGFHAVMYHAAAGGKVDLSDLVTKGTFIGGGSTVSLRWLTLGYVCGFRDFRLFGMDSSFRGNEKHSYKQEEYDDPPMFMHGYGTTYGMGAQVLHFFQTMQRLSEADMEPINVEFYGDGLLPYLAARDGYKVHGGTS